MKVPLAASSPGRFLYQAGVLPPAPEQRILLGRDSALYMQDLFCFFLKKFFKYHPPPFILAQCMDLGSEFIY